MKRHSELGYQILNGIDFLRDAAEIVYAHHERFDGTGYPRGLKADEIPMGARVFAVVDAYDAMTSRRPYREAMSQDDALEEVMRNSGTQFDPQVVIGVPEDDPHEPGRLPRRAGRVRHPRRHGNSRTSEDVTRRRRTRTKGDRRSVV